MMERDDKAEKMYIKLTREKNDVEYCGTKAAGLFELEKMGIPIPKFYVVPVSFFRQFCSSVQAGSLYEFYQHTTFDSAIYQKFFAGQNIWVDCNELTDINGRFIVRSSAVPQENTKKEEFSSKVSGVFESFIADDFSEIGDMIIAVWQSVYSEEAYKKMHVFQPEFEMHGMAAVVQQYIEPVISGIVHTYSDKICVGWIEGSQEEILQGREQGQEIEIYLSDFGEMILRGKEDSIKFVEECSRRRIFRELFDLSIMIQKKRCSEQEIEWVYDGDSVWIVQSQRLL
jgi:Phosphoenolpyruvate synthase/pyruvate phosphate dikinase